MSDFDISEDSDYEEDREWDVLLGAANKNKLIDYLAELCPAYLGLHEGRLEKNIWENLKGTHEERRDQYAEREIESFGEVYAKVMETFKGKDVLDKFLSIPLRDSEENHSEVLEDFWADNSSTWMYVANGDAREIIKPLKPSMELETMADVHRKISMSCINMTELASTILSLDNPDVYAISRCIDEMEEKNYPREDDAMMWNFPAANDVLKHLAKCYKPVEW
jgi:hypothetical protein